MVDAKIDLEGDLALVLRGSSPRASDNIEEKLRWMIITQKLPPGAVIVESHLAKLFDCSHAPLREALNRLDEQGLVQSLPRRGIIISEVNGREMEHLLEIFSCVYERSARLAAQRATSEQLAAMHVILDDLQTAANENNFTAYLQHSRDFHASVARATGNPHLVRSQLRIVNLIARYSYLFWRKAGTADASVEEYRAIVAALEQRDADESERCVRQHLTNAGERIHEGLKGYSGPSHSIP